MCRSALLVAAAVGAGAICLSYVSGQQPYGSAAVQFVEISGTVTDGNGTPIGSVLVRVYSDGKVVGRTRTNDRGKYAVPVRSGKTIGSVWYTHSEWHDGVVELLSGNQAQSIHKVLFSLDAKLSRAEAARQLLVYQSILQSFPVDAIRPGPAPSEGYIADELRDKLARLRPPEGDTQQSGQFAQALNLLNRAVAGPEIEYRTPTQGSPVPPAAKD